MEILVCPACRGKLELTDAVMKEDEIYTGNLVCNCGEKYPIIEFVPRFVPYTNYSDSFGLQWNKFRETQLDKYNGTNISEDRFYNETYWKEERSMEGQWIFEGGCGSGRFLEIAARTKAEVIGVDLSSAVDAARESLKDLPNVHLIQADLFKLPFKEGSFDGVYSIGVIQHTPDPKALFAHFPKYLKQGGKLCLTFYPRKRFTLLYSKYIIRPITKRIPAKIFIKLLRITMPVLFPLTYILFHIPVLNWLFIRMIPVTNYVFEKRLSMKQRYEWALLDTFDMLTPCYDQPQRHAEARVILKKNRIKVDEALSAYEGNIKGIKD